MSVEGNSRLKQVQDHNAFIQSQRPQAASYADSQAIEESKSSIDNLRAQLMGSGSTEGSTADKPGYRNGKFTMRAFLDDQKIGRVGFEEYNDDDLQAMYGGNKKAFVDLDAQNIKIEKLGELHDQRSKLELQLEGAADGDKAGIQSQIDDLNSEITSVLVGS